MMAGATLLPARRNDTPEHLVVAERHGIDLQMGL
jgi:hypothetical protein